MPHNQYIPLDVSQAGMLFHKNNQLGKPQHSQYIYTDRSYQ